MKIKKASIRYIIDSRIADNYYWLDTLILEGTEGFAPQWVKPPTGSA